MASADNVSLRSARQSAFLTEANPQFETVAGGASGATATLSSGIVTFGNLGGALAPPGARYLAGDILYVTGFSGSDADWNGLYEVETSQSPGEDFVACYCPAGKNDLADATASSSDVKIGALLPMRITSEGLAGNLNKRESDEITGARGVQDLIVQGITAGGNTDAEFSLPAWTPYVQAGMMENWTHSGVSGADPSGTGPKGVPVDSDSVTFASSSTIEYTVGWDLSVGDWIKITDSTHNDGCYKVTAVDDISTPKVLTVSHGTLDTTVASETVTITQSDVLDDGATTFPHTIERVYGDITGGSAHYPRFIGLLIDSFGLSATSEGAVTLSVTWAGSHEYGSGDGESGTPTSKLATATSRISGTALESSSGHLEVWLDASTGGCVNSLDATVNNNLDPRLCIGTKGAKSMEARTFNATGSFSRYYESTTIYDKFLSSTSATMVLKFISPDGPALVLDFPRVEYSGGQRGAPGKNQSLFLNMNFTALEDETSGYTVQVHRWER